MAIVGGYNDHAHAHDVESTGHGAGECDTGCDGHSHSHHAENGIAGHSHGHGHGSKAADAQESELDKGRRCMTQGKFDDAVSHLRASLTKEGESVDIHLLMAEALWQQAASAGQQGTDDALPHYEAALRIDKESGDGKKAGMICMGHGYALMQMGRLDAARDLLLQAKGLAEADGNQQAAMFVERLLSQVGAPKQSEEEKVRSTWSQFAEAVSASKPAVLFLCGTLAQPADTASRQAVSKLQWAGCSKLDYVDVTSPGSMVPEGIQGIYSSPHLQFPQLWVSGAQLQGWTELKSEELHGKLKDAGLELGEIKEKEACHGSAAFSEGLEKWEVALVELVSKEGDKKWADKAKKLLKLGVDLPSPANGDFLEAAWTRLRPIVKDKLETQPEMPCGHSCSTCPTRHDCELHDALEGGQPKDIEDLC
eukprot:TRINITY_DN6713_c0_g2_i2.p1 TRINITY_DN6713_c0_g2~~TRINITY_DN6713_c0_g2_i2.p1  ORF type:complete len:423 (+),score=81.64 TRINITY_DN6713_c0_g2_i2:77-1345(+)